MHRILLLTVLAAASALQVRPGTAQREAADQSPPPIRVLIIDGSSNHDWRQTTDIARRILVHLGGCDVAVSTCPPKADAAAWNAWHPAFADYDVVLQNYNNLTTGEDWPDAVKRSLEQYVADGGGLYILHSGNNAFADWPEYNRMIGLGWRRADAGTALQLAADGTITRIPPGEGRGTGHGPRIDTAVHTRGEHPITAGYPERWMTPRLEIYHHARGPAENLTVLSYAFDGEDAGGTLTHWPIQWVVAYGDGRVYNSTLGHVWSNDDEPDAVRCVAFQTNMIRATQWLAGRDVTHPLPDGFPTADTLGLRDVPQP